jgi:hypothetical protein
MKVFAAIAALAVPFWCGEGSLSSPIAHAGLRAASSGAVTPETSSCYFAMPLTDEAAGHAAGMAKELPAGALTDIATVACYSTWTAGAAATGVARTCCGADRGRTERRQKLENLTVVYDMRTSADKV